MRRDFADVGMKESVIADFVAFALYPLHEADVLLRLGADHHEVPLTSYSLENVEDFRGPFGIGTVVEAERDLVRVIAVVLDRVAVRIHVHVLVDDELFARVGLVGVDLYGALAGLRQAGDADDVAGALLSTSCPGCMEPRASSEAGLLGLSQTFHMERSSAPSRQRAKVCRPSWRAARISFSSVTPSRNQTTWRVWVSSSMYSK